MITVEQIVNSQKSNVETSFGLAGTFFEGVQQLIELNVEAAKSALSQAAQTSQAALSIKDPQELVALQATLIQPGAEKAAAYVRGVYDIAASTGVEVTRVVEAMTAEARARFLAVIDTSVKNAPAGSEHGVALVKSAIAAANNAIESAQKASKQATEVAQANFDSLTTTAVRATKSKRAA
ncbi:MAG: phasin family protein [Pseudomonadota bacterium]|nr:phasin family protein [Pseudomonadota bacterium]